MKPLRPTLQGTKVIPKRDLRGGAKKHFCRIRKARKNSLRKNILEKRSSVLRKRCSSKSETSRGLDHDPFIAILLHCGVTHKKSEYGFPIPRKENFLVENLSSVNTGKNEPKLSCRLIGNFHSLSPEFRRPFLKQGRRSRLQGVVESKNRERSLSVGSEELSSVVVRRHFLGKKCRGHEHFVPETGVCVEKKVRCLHYRGKDREGRERTKGTKKNDACAKTMPHGFTPKRSGKIAISPRKEFSRTR